MERDIVHEAFVAACIARADEETVPPRGYRWEQYRDDYRPSDEEVAACASALDLAVLVDRCADRAVRDWVQARAERFLAPAKRPGCGHALCAEIADYCIIEEDS